MSSSVLGEKIQTCADCEAFDGGPEYPPDEWGPCLFTQVLVASSMSGCILTPDQVRRGLQSQFPERYDLVESS